MKDDRTETVLNEAIDGFTSPEREAEVQEILARDPEARAYFEELQQLSRLIAETGTALPPARIKKNVLHAVRTLPVPGAPRPIRVRRPSRFEAFLNLFEAPAFGRMGLVFGSGVAAGLVIFALANPAWQPKGQVTGTLAPAESFGAAAVHPFAVGGVAGTLKARVTPTGIVLLEAAAETGGPARFEIGLRSVAGVVMVERPHPERNQVFLRPDGVTVETTAPDRLGIQLDPEGSPDALVVRVIARGQSVDVRLPLRPEGR